jgi:hypothetical protein
VPTMVTGIGALCHCSTSLLVTLYLPLPPLAHRSLNAADRIQGLACQRAYDPKCTMRG